MQNVDLLIQAARYSAITECRYLAAALWRMELRVAKGIGTMAVSKNWVCYIDPDVLQQWTAKEAGAVLCHEVWHLLRQHFDRCAAINADHMDFNIAGDAEINDDIDGLPNGVIYPSTLKQPEGLMAEDYLPHVA